MKPKPQTRDAFQLFQAHFDQILNAVLAAAGANMRKLLRRFFYALIRWLEGTIVPPSAHSVALKYVA